jgi:sugar/nucleoside kinase (ribokinase family)
LLRDQQFLALLLAGRHAGAQIAASLKPAAQAAQNAPTGHNAAPTNAAPEGDAPPPGPAA